MVEFWINYSAWAKTWPVQALVAPGVTYPSNPGLHALRQRLPWTYRHASIFIYYCMALSIKDPEADRLAREVAKATGESLTTAVVQSLRERLARVRRMRGRSPWRGAVEDRPALRSASGERQTIRR